MHSNIKDKSSTYFAVDLGAKKKHQRILFYYLYDVL